MDQKPDIKQPKLLHISVINFFSFLDINLILPVMALYASSIGANPGIIGLLIGLYSITDTPTNIFAGRLIDKVGYKLPMIAGLAGGMVSMFSYSLVKLPFHLALVRSIHGICGGLKSPAIMSVFINSTGESKRGKVMSFYGMSLAAANLVGFSLSGVIVSQAGYQPLFYTGASILAVGVIMGLLLPKAKRQNNAMTESSLGRDYGKVKSLLRKKGLLVSFSAIFAQYFAFGGVITLLPLYVKNLGMEAFHVGMLLTTFTVLFIILQFPSGILSDKIGRLKMVYTGLSLGIISLIILPMATSFFSLLIIMGLYGVAFGLLFPSVSALIADQTITEERGLASGIFHALLTSGVAIGAPVIGGVSSLVGITTGLALSPVILVAALVFSLVIVRR